MLFWRTGRVWAVCASPAFPCLPGLSSFIVRVCCALGSSCSQASPLLFYLILMSLLFILFHSRSSMAAALRISVLFVCLNCSLWLVNSW